MKREDGVLTRKLTKSQHSAIKAMARGDADAYQQQRFLDWLIESACGTYDVSFIPDDDSGRLTSFKEGRRFVGLQLIGFIKREMMKNEEYTPEKTNIL
jgi:hypothetical protein